MPVAGAIKVPLAWIGLTFETEPERASPTSRSSTKYFLFEFDVD
jgi:hypothetical protein